MYYENYLILALIILVVQILLFFIFREIFLWYWKINKIVDLLGEIKKNTSTKNTEVVLPQDASPKT